MKFPLGCAAVAAAIGFAASQGCMTHPPRTTAPTAKSAGDPSEPSGVVRVGDVSVSGFDATIAASTLDDPALAKVKAFVVATDWTSAAKELEGVISKAPPTGRELLRWRYQLGHLRLLAGDLAGAAEAFDQVAEGQGSLAPYAQFGAA